jgi:hypothetical protein
MSTDIRRCGKEDLDRMNLEIARYKAARGGEPDDADVISIRKEQRTNNPPSKHIAEQLDLFS